MWILFDINLYFFVIIWNESIKYLKTRSLKYNNMYFIKNII